MLVGLSRDRPVRFVHRRRMEPEDLVEVERKGSDQFASCFPPSLNHHHRRKPITDRERNIGRSNSRMDQSDERHLQISFSTAAEDLGTTRPFDMDSRRESEEGAFGGIQVRRDQ